MHTLRFPFAVGSGLLVTLALFTLLCTFIGRTVPVDRVAKSNDVIYTRPIIEPPVPPKPREKIDRPPERPLLTLPGIQGIDRSDMPAVLTGARTFLYEPYTAKLDMGHDRPVLGQDREAIPLVRIPPDYPPGANIEGWVKVQFSITAAGTVRDAFVVDARPKGVFDNAALKAIARWRYSPKVDGGVAVERVGLQTLIHFELQ
jgi:periplasmic protein TonB